MKRILVFLVVVMSSLTMSAQPHFKVASNPDILRNYGRIFPERTEIVLPQVNGYNVYKVDLYIYTIYSDAHVTPETIGHFNALFTTDNDAIYDPDPVRSFRNARAQGALIMHNHPGWRRSSLDMIEFDMKVYPAGLIDGIKVMNHLGFYPRAIDMAEEYGLFMASNTDITALSAT